MDDIMAQFGFGVAEPDSEDKMRGLAKTLRGNRDLGQFFQFSGNKDVRNAGQNMLDTSQDTINTIGDRRSQGLTRTMQQKRDAQKTKMDDYKIGRDAEQDALKAEALEYARDGWTDIEEKVNSDGMVAMYGLKDGRGTLQMIPGSAFLKDRDKYAGRSKGTGKGMRIQLPGTDAVIWKHPDGRIDGPKGEDFKNFAEFAVAYPKFAAMEAAINSSMAKGMEASSAALGQGWADELVGVASDMRENTAAMSGSMQALADAEAAIADGALTGKAWSMFPTLTNATSRFETAMADLTLTQLSEHKLTPVSDKDLAVLRQKAAPDMYPAEMTQWLQHKQESLRRIRASNQYIESQLRGKSAIPTGEEAERIKREADAILRQGDFDFTFDRTYAGQNNTGQNNGGRPSWIKADDPRWDTLSDEQKAAIIAARKD